MYGMLFPFDTKALSCRASPDNCSRGSRENASDEDKGAVDKVRGVVVTERYQARLLAPEAEQKPVHHLSEDHGRAAFPHADVVGGRDLTVVGEDGELATPRLDLLQELAPDQADGGIVTGPVSQR